MHGHVDAFLLLFPCLILSPVKSGAAGILVDR